jgi:homocysteine S-methyltransferase
MHRKDLLAMLDERVLIADGAMGTQIYDRGITFEHCFDELNLSEPDLIREIHRGYIDAGADLIETNTFGTNRVRLGQWGLEEHTREIALAGARIARQAVEEAGQTGLVLVAGSMGPLGRPLAPIGKISREEAREYFRETAEALVEGGVDLIALETFVDQVEASEALMAVREVAPDLAVIAHLTFTDEGKTVYGNKPEEVARGLMVLGADVVGANCSVGPQGLDDVVDRMLRVPDVRLSLMPNAGLPQIVGGRCVYLASPQYMARHAEEFCERGAAIVGGCCGTGPEHIAAIRERVGVRRPVHPRLRMKRDSGVVAVAAVAAEPEASEPGFLDKIAEGRFVVSVELDPPKGIDATRLVRGAMMCKAAGIDAINIADSPLARARMSPLALSTLIRQSVDIEIILHLSCRDRNILGLQSECMGSHALGMRNILAVTGDPPQVGDYPDATGVFDVDSVGLVRLLSRLNQGVDLAGKALRYQTRFRVGVASNPTAVDLELELERWFMKLDAGAQFTMTQPIYDIGVLERWLDKAKSPIPVLVGVLPLRNGRHAEFLHNEVPGMSVPEAIQERMRAAGPDGPEEGVRIASEFLAEARKLVQGAYLMPPFDRFEMAIDVCRTL